MLNNNEYEVMKDSFVKSQRFFSKLAKVATQAKEIDYDESGQYFEEEEMLERHWLKLSSKIIDALGEDMQGYSIELLKNSSLEETELKFNLIKEDTLSKISVNYQEVDSLHITQIS